MQDRQSLTDAFERYLKDQQFERPPTGLYAPVAYIMKSGGKRLRPLLALIGARLFSEDATPALPVAMAVEIFHNFSLVHDDIMDEAPLRRGKPAVHQAYGLNAGILSGDVMLILAYQYLEKAGDAAVASRLFSIFSAVAVEVCEGQQYDVDFEQRDDVSIAEYISMIEQKTAALIGGSLQMGAIAAGAAEEQAGKLRDFGRNIGIAFQMQDDILDAFGDPKHFGKRVGGDIVQNKKTFLILEALQRAAGDTRQELQQLMSTQPADEEAKISRVTALLRELGIPQWAEEQKARYQNKAFAALAEVEVPEARKQLLRELSEQLMRRVS